MRKWQNNRHEFYHKTARLIEESFVPRLRLIELTAADTIEALRSCASAGVRGGAILDFLHLMRHIAKRIAHALMFVSLSRKLCPIEGFWVGQ